MPEKRLNEVPPPLRELYEKGLTALNRNNFDYAISLLSQVLESEPAFYECRAALRATQFKKFGTGGGFFKKVFGGASAQPNIAKGQFALRKNPIEALAIAEQILSNDPHNSSAHKLLAEAAMACDLPKTAVLSLEIVVKNAPNDRNSLMLLAEAHAQNDQTDRAEAIYTELLKANPHDNEVASALKDLSARKTMAEGGYDALADGGGSYRDILKNKEESVSIEQEKREVKSEDLTDKLIQEYEERIQQEPRNLKLLRTVADLYTQKKNFDRAFEYYNYIVSVEGSADSSLEKAISDTQLKKFDHQISQLDQKAPDYAKQEAQLQKAREDFLLSDCQRRSEKYPTDLQIRFDLGRLYFRAGKISEAIQEFQKAQNNPQRRIQALSFLGQCFSSRGMNDLAARTLQNALKEKIVFDDEKKDLLYALGSVLEKMGKKDEAVEPFKQIYEVDIGYRDVAAKVEAYYAGQ